jgi:sulfite exporter TauE/SafE
MFFARLKLNRSLGWLTPLLPCGPLWLMLVAASLTGGAWNGGLLMAAFTLGTIPLPLLVQTQAMRWLVGLPSMRWFRPALSFGSAGLLIWRASLPLHACCH